MTEPHSYAAEDVNRFDRSYLWHYRAKWLSTEYLDGDTFTVLVDTGFHGREEVRIRLPDVQAPERDTEQGRVAAGQLFVALHRTDTTRKWDLRLVTRQLITKTDESTTFERYVADVYLIDSKTGQLVGLEAKLAEVQAEQAAS